MSIDFYPAADAGRDGSNGRENIGAAALLYDNDPTLFPDFAERDLKSLLPSIKHTNLTFDGATTFDWLDHDRLKSIPSFSGETLVTLTLGGNDLLQVIGRKSRGDSVDLSQAVLAVKNRFEEVLAMIQKKVPNNVVILSTVYDPTDGTGILPTSSPLFESVLPIEYLYTFNDFVRSFAAKSQYLLADVHKHFEGHGALCGSAEKFWYWKPSPIEPGYLGASEIRRVWFDTLKANGLHM